MGCRHELVPGLDDRPQRSLHLPRRQPARGCPPPGHRHGRGRWVRPHEANQMISDAVDLLVQIGIRHEVRRVVQVANISKELKSGDVWFEPIFCYNEQSPL